MIRRSLDNTLQLLITYNVSMISIATEAKMKCFIVRTTCKQFMNARAAKLGITDRLSISANVAELCWNKM